MTSLLPADPPGPRERILAAAVDLFSDRGFAATSVRDVATKVGLTPGALYNHFAGKQEILAEISLSDVAILRDRIQQAAAEPAATIDRLRNIITALADHAIVRRDPMRIAAREASLLPEAAARELAEMQRDVIDTLAAALSDAVRQDIVSWIPADGNSLRATARFISHGLIQAGNSLDHDPGWDTRAIIDLHIGLVMNLLLGKQLPPPS